MVSGSEGGPPRSEIGKPVRGSSNEAPSDPTPVPALEARIRALESALEDRVRRARESDLALRSLGRRYHGLRELLGPLQQSVVYRGMVRIGAWRQLDAQLSWHRHGGADIASPGRSEGRSPLDSSSRPDEKHRPDGAHRIDRKLSLDWRDATARGPEPRRGDAIAVDLTAIRPGGVNGGSKRVALALLRAMAAVEPARRVVAFVDASCRDEIERAVREHAANGLEIRTADGADFATLDGESEAFGVQFCPMTAPQSAHPVVPLVCTIHDLQHDALPMFFDEIDRLERQASVARAVRDADRLVTVSEFVRQTVLEAKDLEADRVVTIHNLVVDSVASDASDSAPSESVQPAAQDPRPGLEVGRYLLYPANFWPHKNHAMLIAAFGQFCAQHPETDWRLVLTGATEPSPEPICAAIAAFGLGPRVVLPGYVSAAELSALFGGCRALVFRRSTKGSESRCWRRSRMGDRCCVRRGRPCPKSRGMPRFSSIPGVPSRSCMRSSG